MLQMFENRRNFQHGDHVIVLSRSIPGLSSDTRACVIPNFYMLGDSFLCRWDPRALGQEDSKGILKKEKIELPAEEANTPPLKS